MYVYLNRNWAGKLWYFRNWGTQRKTPSAATLVTGGGGALGGVLPVREGGGGSRWNDPKLPLFGWQPTAALFVPLNVWTLNLVMILSLLVSPPTSSTLALCTEHFVVGHDTSQEQNMCVCQWRGFAFSTFWAIVLNVVLDWHCVEQAAMLSRECCIELSLSSGFRVELYRIVNE